MTSGPSVRTRDSMIVWVVDPLSPVTRREVGAVRDTALAVHGEIPIEVVVTGDRPGSEAAARTVVSLLASGEVHPVRVVEDVTRAHHDDHDDLGDPEVVQRLATQRGQDAEAIVLLSASPAAAAMVTEDRATARALRDPADHALFVFGRRGAVRLPGPGASAREIIAAIREAL